MKTSNKIFLWLTLFVVCCFFPPLFAIAILGGLSIALHKLVNKLKLNKEPS